jgi:hypothetical protein
MSERNDRNNLEYIHELSLSFNGFADRERPVTGLASESHVSFTVAILEPVPGTIAKSALVRAVVVLPRLVSILECDWVEIASLGLNLDGPRQMAGNAEGLGVGIDGLLLSETNNLACSIIDDGVKGVICSNAVLVALVLDHVHGAPSGSEAGRGIDGLEDAEAKGCGTNLGNAACVRDAAALRVLSLLAQVAGVSLRSVDELFHVEVFPVVEARKAQNGVVKAVFGVSINASRFGVLYGD